MLLILSKNSDNIHGNLIINPFDIEPCVIEFLQKILININIKKYTIDRIERSASMNYRDKLQKFSIRKYAVGTFNH